MTSASPTMPAPPGSQGYAEHTDPTQTVDFQNPDAVCAAIDALLGACYGKAHTPAAASLLAQAIQDLTLAFRGDYPGLLRCDTHYHDLRHALDSGLAMARLLDGHAQDTPAHDARHIDAEHALLGVLLALYHDIGLLRHDNEAHLQGAQLTPIHEARGVDFMRKYLAHGLLSHLAPKAELIMVTRLVWHLPDDMRPRERALACLLGTADIMSQLADRCYLEKCRDFLFIEFSAIGLAGAPELTYPDPESLLRNTPAFWSGLLRERIEKEYAGANRYMKIHFGGQCPYEAAIARNFSYLEHLLADDDLARLQRTPKRLIDPRQDGE